MTNKSKQALPKPKGFPVVAGIFTIFLAPICLAWILYHHHYLGNSTTNVGQLLAGNPQLSQIHFTQQPAPALHGSWRLIYIPPSDSCETDCQKTLYKLRQVRIATGKNRNRVQRWALFTHIPSFPNNWKKLHPDLLSLQIDQASQQRLTTLSHGGILLADPLGNLVMTYPTSVSFKGLLKDLQHLLKVSQIG